MIKHNGTQTLAGLLKRLGYTHRASDLYGSRDVLRGDKVIGRFSAEQCWTWLRETGQIVDTPKQEARRVAAEREAEERHQRVHEQNMRNLRGEL